MSVTTSETVLYSEDCKDNITIKTSELFDPASSS